MKTAKFDSNSSLDAIIELTAREGQEIVLLNLDWASREATYDCLCTVEKKQKQKQKQKRTQAAK